MAGSDQDRVDGGGSGPLYERGEAGQKAADEPVDIPGSSSEDPSESSQADEAQAAAHREADPPA